CDDTEKAEDTEGLATETQRHREELFSQRRVPRLFDIAAPGAEREVFLCVFVSLWPVHSVPSAHSVPKHSLPNTEPLEDVREDVLRGPSSGDFFERSTRVL